MELVVACQHLFVQHRVDLHAIVLNQTACAFVVALALDALNFGEQLAKQFTQGGIVVYLDVRFAMLLYQFNHLVGFALLIGPAGNEGTVAHVRLLNVVAWFDAHELRHEAVHHVGVVLALVCLEVGCQTEVHQLLVGYIVQAEQVGTCLLDG